MRRRVVLRPDQAPPAAFRGNFPTYASAAPQSLSQNPAWPPAPEQTPMFSPPVPTYYPPAPAANMAWGSGISQPQVSSTSPFSLAELPPQVPETPVVNPMFRLANATGGDPSPAPIQLPASTEPILPSIPPTEWQAQTWQPPKKSSPLLPAILLLLGIVGTCLWVLRDDLFPALVVEIPVSKPVDKALPAPTPAPQIQPATATPVPSKPPAELEPEIRRAEIPTTPPTVDLVAAGVAAQDLFKALVEAKTPEARAALIAQPEEQASDMEEFFASKQPKLTSLKPSGISPQLLPGHQVAALFQVYTDLNPKGALMRLVPQASGRFLLDWPLFAETHEQKLANFLKTKPADPAWFHVGIRRSHALEIPEPQRSIQIAFEAQGSSDSSIHCLTVVQKDTPIGRYLGRETEWSTVYIARLLLQHRKLEDGTPAIVILDCEGAATSSAP